MDVQEDATLADGYKLKLNSYDLGVDIELADAIQRLRFEHPEVGAVIASAIPLGRGRVQAEALHEIRSLGGEPHRDHAA